MSEEHIYVGCNLDGFQTVDEALHWIYEQKGNNDKRYVIHCHSSVEVD